MWWSSIPPTSTKRPITSHLNSKIKTTRYDVGNDPCLSLGQAQTYGGLNRLMGSQPSPPLLIKMYNFSEWLLFNANRAISQLYHGENKLIFNEMMRSLFLSWDERWLVVLLMLVELMTTTFHNMNWGSFSTGKHICSSEFIFIFKMNLCSSLKGCWFLF
jgi:hypothetical protein